MERPMIESVQAFITSVLGDIRDWGDDTKPWFRGESGGDQTPLCPKIAGHSEGHENYVLQTFRRKAGGIQNAPLRDQTDVWLFWAQHHGIPTRLLDWTEGALTALYFAVNQRRKRPIVYMLDPHKLNEIVTKRKSDHLNYPISWDKLGYENIALAWEKRNRKRGLKFSIALRAVYFDQRMIAQKSCFTVHGSILSPFKDVLTTGGVDPNLCLKDYPINEDLSAQTRILKELSYLGTSAATVYPDLDHLADDIRNEIG